MNGDSMKRPWKILFTIPNFDTAGSGIALINIAKNLDKQYFEPHICCDGRRGDLIKIIEELNIPIYFHKTTHAMKPRIKGFYKCIELAKFFKNLKIDLIHSFHYGPDYSEALAAKLIGIPWIYTKKNMKWGGASANGWKLRSLLASHIIVQNRDMIIKFFKNNKNISLIQRGIDKNIFFKRDKNIQLLKINNISEEDFVILTVANLVPIKGIEYLIDAFLKISKSHTNVSLVIVGDYNNEYGLKMIEIARKSVLNHKIHFIGKVSNVYEYYSIADIFVIPTLSPGEGCPVALLEAMASGLVAVGSNTSGISDILGSYRSLLFKPKDVDDIVKKIKPFIYKRKVNTSESLTNLVKKKYIINHEVSKHELTYRSCLSH